MFGLMRFDVCFSTYLRRYLRNTLRMWQVQYVTDFGYSIGESFIFRLLCLDCISLGSEMLTSANSIASLLFMSRKSCRRTVAATEDNQLILKTSTIMGCRLINVSLRLLVVNLLAMRPARCIHPTQCTPCQPVSSSLLTNCSGF